ncbi:Wzz/FepE/Etk N-terminal domain-containing protein [Pseudomonas sp. SG20056]|uniref:LPS O-antigen chain length determinant protein WzzB n=1 Tax=Pseudomonas sp. SG20056 TaxID=3074146 RepID=UPI00287F576B|nr:Wzz/FepE/Etk N-terminal domain-containing protein [Pseudomonas sp. SG20056]WNF45449.1 Wzz/FepE/Etk N-terminal domain-containing protein [Pseudomonas sp. SG20056]
MSTFPGTHYEARDDEIDLVEVIQNLWTQKWLIVACMVVAIAFAAAFAFLSAPVYEASSGVLPPRPSEIADYNQIRREINLAELKVADVYRVFTRNLLAGRLKRELFLDTYLPSLSDAQAGAAEDQLWAEFNSMLKVRAPDSKSSPGYFIITLKHADPQIAADWVNRYLSKVAEKSEADLEANLLAEINSRVQSIEREIEILRSGAQTRREDRIVRLLEAKLVAEAAGIDSPKMGLSETASSGELSEFVSGNLDYMRGFRAIRAELAALEQRKSDDPFISELRELEDRLTLLRSLDVASGTVAVYTLDHAAEVPQTPIKPNKSLIMTLGLVLGGMLGVFAALVRSVLLGRTRG